MKTLICILGFIFILLDFAAFFMCTPIFKENFIDSQYHKNMRTISIILCIIVVLLTCLVFTISYSASIVLFLLAILLGFWAKSEHKTMLSCKKNEERFLELLKTFSPENQKELLKQMTLAERVEFSRMLNSKN